MASAVIAGVDRLLGGDEPSVNAHLRGRRVGLLTNDLALTAEFEPARVALAAAGWRFEVIFSPEHGLSGRAREGEHVCDDALDGVPVRSLYGTGVRPEPRDLTGLDALLVDLPDVGARFYTYIWTISHVLEACADAGVDVVILDRPNPLGGDLDLAEGPMLDERCQSFVGRWPIPVRHSLTIGELCRHWVRSRSIDVALEVVRCGAADRSAMSAWQRSGVWVPPSPNMPSPVTALLYPGTCLAEGINVSEGRGTAVPFRVMAAPFLDGEALARRVRESEIAGLSASHYGFTPLARDYAGQACDGILLHVTDPDQLRPVSAGVRVLSLIAEQAGGMIEERPGLPLPGEADVSALEKLFGRVGAFDQIVGGAWDDPAAFEVPQWRDAVRADLLYP